MMSKLELFAYIYSYSTNVRKHNMNAGKFYLFTNSKWLLKKESKENRKTRRTMASIGVRIEHGAQECGDNSPSTFLLRFWFQRRGSFIQLPVPIFLRPKNSTTTTHPQFAGIWRDRMHITGTLSSISIHLFLGTNSRPLVQCFQTPRWCC